MKDISSPEETDNSKSSRLFLFTSQKKKGVSFFLSTRRGSEGKKPKDTEKQDENCSSNFILFKKERERKIFPAPNRIGKEGETKRISEKEGRGEFSDQRTKRWKRMEGRKKRGRDVHQGNIQWRGRAEGKMENRHT